MDIFGSFGGNMIDMEDLQKTISYRDTDILEDTGGN